MFTVYALCSRRSQKIYVGMTGDLCRRLRQHRWWAKHGSNSHLSNAIRLYGWSDFIIVVLAVTPTEQIAFQLERAWIADLNLMKNGYNMTEGGEGNANPSEETRAKLAEATRHRWTNPILRAKELLNQAKGAEGLCRKWADQDGSRIMEEIRVKATQAAVVATRGRRHTGARLEKTRATQKIATANAADSNRGRRLTGDRLEKVRAGAAKARATMLENKRLKRLQAVCWEGT